MNFQIHQREREGFQILDLQGHLMIGDSEAKLRSEVAALTEARLVGIILNLADLVHIDDDGLEALVFCHARSAEAGGALKLLNLPDHLSLMALTKLDTVFEVFSDEQEAVNSFFPDRPPVHRYDILEWVEEQEQNPAPDPAE
jgi:anti-sigma B factor antagonist